MRKKVKLVASEKKFNTETNVDINIESSKNKNDDPVSVDVLNSPYLCFLEVRDG